MEEFYTIKGGTIPPFGNWDYEDELSYTHYFSCASQASAVAAAGYNCYSPGYTEDLYAIHSSQPRRNTLKKGVKEHRKQNDMKHQQKQSLKQPRTKNNCTRRETICQYAKPVDEDLYKIPPELIRAYKKKKVVGFFTRLMPTCIR